MQIPTYLTNIFTLGISVLIIVIVITIVVKCGCFIYKTICETIENYKINHDDWFDDDDDSFGITDLYKDDF